MTDLSIFCASQSDPRTYLHKPFSFDKFSCYSNGHMAVFVERVAWAPEMERESLILGICHNTRKAAQKRGTESKILPLSQFSTALTECRECKGAGYICECKVCGGTGEVKNRPFEECDICDGSGSLPIQRWREVKTRYHRCETCLGIGVQPYEQDSKIGAIKLQTRYLLAAKTLPNATVRAFGSHDPALIEFDGGFGLIMPLRY
jgi:hypothetical protein